MTALRKTVLAAAALLGASSAFAMPSFQMGENSITFQANENQYRSLAACTALAFVPGFGPTNCLPAQSVTKPDPAGYRRVNPAIAGNFLPDDVAAGFGLKGDIFAGVFSVTGVEPLSLPTGEFTGYFAQRIMSIDTTVPTSAIITLGTVAPADDPFGKLAAGEMFRFYTDTIPEFAINANVSAATSVARATDGTTGDAFWGSLGLGSEGYAYTIDNLTISGSDDSFLANEAELKLPRFLLN